ncbi:MAG: hypothetical protein GY827_10780 [Cytophagales bacterium]|nr:hypothetical protein [Cytophagales bacterium]
MFDKIKKMVIVLQSQLKSKKTQELQKMLNNLHDDYKTLEKENHSYRLYAMACDEKIEGLKEDKKELEKRQVPLPNIELPKNTMASLEKKLKKCDKYTIDFIISYLDLDTYNLVKKIPSVLNRTNDVEVGQYMD